MPTPLEVVEGVQYQSSKEQLAWAVDVSNWASTPAGVSVAAYLEGGGIDVTSTVLSGASSVSGNIITLPMLGSLSAGKTYRIETEFTSGGNTYNCYLRVECLV